MMYIYIMKLKQKLLDTIKNIEISITLNFNSEFELKTINEILQILGVKINKLINFKDINNLLKILPQIISKNLRNFIYIIYNTHIYIKLKNKAN